MEHSWTILNERILTEHLGQTDVLRTIWFRLTTTSDSGNITEIDGRVNLNIDNLDNFLPYQSLTKSDRVNFIKGHAADFYENLNLERLTQI